MPAVHRFDWRPGNEPLPSLWASKPYEQAKVRLDDQRRVVDPAVRVALASTDAVALTCPRSLQQRFSDLVFPDRWTVVRYPEGGFVAPHHDPCFGQTHLGSLLLIAPKRVSHHRGGTLVLREPLGNVVVEASPTHWLAVYVPLHVEHELRPVESGERVVLIGAAMASERNARLCGPIFDEGDV